jgi:hypothetical protein
VEEKATIWLEYSRNFSELLRGFSQMLNNHIGRNKVERFIGERKMSAIAAHAEGNTAVLP